ncbi:MAG: Hsp20/alpha crystallin family protein [Desulfobacteraceae bacterium]
MAIVKWDPFRNAAALQDRINKLFEDSFPHHSNQDEDLSTCGWRPLVDIFETENGVVIRIDLPGVKKEDVAVEIKDNILTLRGERIEDQIVHDESYLRRERCCGHFQRSFNLHQSVMPENIKATFKDGVLEVVIQKPEVEEPKKIEINID